MKLVIHTSHGELTFERLYAARSQEIGGPIVMSSPYLAATLVDRNFKAGFEMTEMSAKELLNWLAQEFGDE